MVSYEDIQEEVKGMTENSMPMRYYRSLRVLTIIWIAAGVLSIGGIFLTGFSVMRLMMGIISLVLAAAACIGLWKMKWYGVLAVYASFVLGGLNSIYQSVAVISDGGITEYAAGVIGSVIGSLIILIPTYIYFRKRRHLFE